MGEYYGVRTKDDPDGEYLQHWGVPKGFTREVHKYLARIPSPSGGYRYLYTQAQVAAARAGRAIRNATGIGLKSQVQAAKARAQRRTSENNSRREQSVSAIKRARNARNYAKNMQKTYDNSLMGRAEKAFNSARKGLDDLGKQASKQAKNIRRNAENAVQKAVRSTSTGRELDDKYGVTKMGRLNKRSAEFKKKSLDSRYRTKNGMLDDNRRSNSEFANRNIRTGFSSGHGDDNPGTKQLKEYLNNRREEKRVRRTKRTEYNNEQQRRMQDRKTRSVRGGTTYNDHFNKERPVTAKSRKSWEENTRKKAGGNKEVLYEHVPSARRRNTTNPNSKSAQLMRRGVDSALNLMRTGQGLDPYNITKRGAEYRRKKRR